jgi:hypothetical protein
LHQLLKETVLDTLSPREIQFRVRAGETPEMVAASTGWPLDKVARYAEPPLGERAYVAERAQKAQVRASRGGATLQEVIESTLNTQDIFWDSTFFDGQWLVTAQAGNQIAQWVFEPAGNSVHPANDEARAWMGVEPVRIVNQAASDSPAEAPQSGLNDTIILETSAVELPLDHAENSHAYLKAVPALDVDIQSENVSDVDSMDNDDSLLITQEHPKEASKPQPPQPKKSKRGRAKVPSWDEILFGGPKDDN